MPYKRKDSAVYWASYIDPSGKRVRRSTGTTNRKEAAALEAKWKLEAYRSQQWDEQPDRSFEDLMVGYLTETKDQKRSWQRDRCSVKQLRVVFAGCSLNTIGAAEISAYKLKRKADGVKDATIAKELRLLSAAINYARKEWGWDIVNPVQGRCPKEGPGRIRWITEKEAQVLLHAVDTKRAPWLKDFIVLGLHTGMRRGELLELTWDQVDLGNRLLYLNPEDQKNGTHGSVPINKDARQALMRRFQFGESHCPTSQYVFCNRQGKRIANVRRSFSSACERAGIQDFRVHDLRHTCAAWLVQKGVPIRTVSDMLRHKDIRTTMRYAHLAPENLREAAATLESRSRFGHVFGSTEMEATVSP